MKYPRLLLFVTFIVLYFSCKKKEESNPFPPALFKTRMWHQVSYKPRYTSSGAYPTITDTIVGPDISAAITFVDNKTVSFKNENFFWNGASKDNFSFAPKHVGLSATEVLYYDVATDKAMYIMTWAYGERDYMSSF